MKGRGQRRSQRGKEGPWEESKSEGEGPEEKPKGEGRAMGGVKGEGHVGVERSREGVKG